MPETRELIELRREIVESRNQAIKTDNQVTNLGIDIKAFEKRFDLLERRTRMASVGANIVVAVVILAAAYLVHSVRTSSLRSKLEEAQTATEQTRRDAHQRTGDLNSRVTAVEEAAARRERVEAAAANFLNYLDAGREKQAEAALAEIDLKAAGPAVKKIAGPRVEAFRRENAEAAYRAGRTHANAGRDKSAVVELRRCLRLEPEGRFATQAAYVIATSLWSLKKYDEAAGVLRDMQKREIDGAVANEVQFLLGASLVRSGKREEGLPILEAVVATGNKYAATSRSYVAALKAGEELPVLPGSRPRSARPATSDSGSNPTSAPPADPLSPR